MPPKQNRVAECVLGDRRWAVPCSSPTLSPRTRLFLLRLQEPCIVTDVVIDTRLPCAITDVMVCCPQIDDSQGWSSAKVIDSLGCKFMGVASFLLLHLQCEGGVSDQDLLSQASALIDGYVLSRPPPASRVVPLLNICSTVHRMPLPHLAAQSELHLAFALAAARKHVQVAEMLQRGEHTLLCCARMPSQRRIACRLAAQCELVAAEGLSLHTHALLKLQCFHTAAVLWAAHSSHALCDLLCERARASEEIASLRLGLEDVLAQAAVSLRIPPITQLCAGNRSVLLGIAPLLWPLIITTLKTGSAPLVQAACAAAEFIVEQCGCSIASVSQVSRRVLHAAPAIHTLVQNCLSSLITVLFECHPYALIARQSPSPQFTDHAPPPHPSVTFGVQFDAVDGVSDSQFPQSTRDAFNRLIEAVHSLLPHFSAEHLIGLLGTTLSPLISAPLVDYSQGSVRVLVDRVQSSTQPPSYVSSPHPTVLQLRLQQLRFLIICVRCLGGDIQFSSHIFDSLLANASVLSSDLPSSILRKSTLKAWAAWCSSLSLQALSPEDLLCITSRLEASSALIASSRACAVAGAELHSSQHGMCLTLILFLVQKLACSRNETQSHESAGVLFSQPQIRMLTLVSSLYSCCRRLTWSTTFEAFRECWFTLHSISSGCFPPGHSLNVLPMASALLLPIIDVLASASPSLVSLQFVLVVLAVCPPPSFSDASSNTFYRLFRIFGDCIPHSTHDETFLVLGHLFRLCRSTMTPDLAAHLSLCLTHRYTVKSSACSKAQLQFAEVVSNGDPSVLAEVLDSCLNYDLADNDVTLQKLKLVQLCVTNLSPRASVNVADILLDSWASCQGLLLHIDSKIRLKSLAILNAIGVCAVSACSLLVSDGLHMQPALYMLLEAHLFNPHYIALRQDDAELQLHSLAACHSLIGSLTAHGLLSVVPVEHGDVSGGMESVQRLDLEAECVDRRFDGASSRRAPVSPPDADSGSEHTDDPAHMQQQLESVSHRWLLSMWPVVSKLLDSPWSTIRTASVALLTLIASCTQRHACCSTLSYRRFQVVMIDSVQRLLLSCDWRSKLGGLRCLTVYCKARRHDALAVILSAPPPTPPLDSTPTSPSRHSRPKVIKVAASVPVFEYGEVTQDALLREVQDNDSGALDHPSLTDIGSFSADVQRLWATVQELQGSCNSSVAHAAQSLCSLAFRAVDVCGVAARDLPPNLVSLVCAEGADGSDFDSQYDFQHQQQLQQPQLSHMFCSVAAAPSSSVPLAQVLHSFTEIDRNLRISSPHKNATCNSSFNFEDAASLIGAMASAHSLAPRLWDETIEVMRGVETLEDFAEDSSVSLLRHWHSQPLSDSDDDIEESADDLLVDGLGCDSLLDLVVDEVDGVGDDDGLDETDSLPRLRGNRPSSAGGSSRRPSDRVRRSSRLQSPPDSIACAGGLGASNRGGWRALWGGSGEMCRATYAPHSLSPVPPQLQGCTPPSSSQGRFLEDVPSLHGRVLEHEGGSDGSSSTDGNVEEDSDDVSRVTYSPPAPSVRVWPRPSDRFPAAGRRVMSAGCSSVLSGTSTAIGSEPFIDIRDSPSSDAEFLSTSEDSEGEEVDVLALLDALDSGVSVSFERSHSSSSAAFVSSDGDESEGDIDEESHRVADDNIAAARGRAWAEKVAFSSNLPGAVDDTGTYPVVASPSTTRSSASHDNEILVEDVSEDSGSSADSFEAVGLHTSSILHPSTGRASNDGTQSHHQQNQPRHQADLSQAQLHTLRDSHASSSHYNLSAAFEHARSRVSPPEPPFPPFSAPRHVEDVTLDSAFTRVSLAESVPHKQTSRYGTTGSSAAYGTTASSASYGTTASSAAYGTTGSSAASVIDAAAAPPDVQSRFHLPGCDIGRSMQALWSLQATWDDGPVSKRSPSAGGS